MYILNIGEWRILLVLDQPSSDLFILLELNSLNILQSIQSNWNNKINMIQYGILYTSSRLVGTSVEDSADRFG